MSASARPSVLAVLGALRARDLAEAWDGGSAWSAQCPLCHSHGITALTLRISERVEGGPAEVRCRNRCEPAAILAALGLDRPAVEMAASGRVIRSRALADFEVRAVDWLWRQRIPAGELTILGGDGGLGKSTFLAHLAGLVTRGEITGLNGTGRVLVVLGEDDATRVITARYQAAEADMTKVEILAADEGAGDEAPVLPDDLPRIREAVERLPADLLVVDPLAAHLAGNVDAHRDGGRGGLRAVLTPLSRLAQSTGTTVVCVAHYNKGNGPASQRLGGAAALRNAARNVLAFARHPDARGQDGQAEDDGRRVLGHDKCNVGAQQPSLLAVLRSVPVANADGSPLLDKDGEPATTSVLEVGDESDIGYEEALQAAATVTRHDDDERGQLDEAMDFIRAELADGPIPSRALLGAATDAGIAERTLARARKQLGIKPRKTANCWTVSLLGTDGALGNLDNAAEATHTPKPPKRAVAANDPNPALAASTATEQDAVIRATLHLAQRCACDHPLPSIDEDGNLHCLTCGRATTWRQEAA